MECEKNVTICENCNDEFDKSMNFCPNCGTENYKKKKSCNKFCIIVGALILFSAILFCYKICKKCDTQSN